MGNEGNKKDENCCKKGCRGLKNCCGRMPWISLTSAVLMVAAFTIILIFMEMGLTKMDKAFKIVCTCRRTTIKRCFSLPSIPPPPPPRLSLASILWSNEWWLFFLFPPTSHDLQYISKTSGFTRLSMKIKCVCGGLINLYISFHNNRTMWSTNLHVTYKNLQVVGGGG